MNIAIAMDSFKGSLTSLEAGRAVERGIKRALPDASVIIRPMADGGEGTVDALAEGLCGRIRKITVSGPLGTPVDCAYAIADGTHAPSGKNPWLDSTPFQADAPRGSLAVIEMAGAAGLPLVPPDQRNPLKTSTFGVGEVILDALDQGCRRFIIGIGGSATNDGGAGMLSALGYQLLDGAGRPIHSGAEGLLSLASIDESSVLPALSKCSFRVACDVTNPLCGPRGASAVFGPQKGASPEMIPLLDKALSNLASAAAGLFPGADPAFPGSGAAGGLGFALRTFLNASLEHGADIIMDAVGLESAISLADLVITGEGRMDGQTSMGKTPAGVARIAGHFKKPVIAFAGCVSPEASAGIGGIDACFPILREITSLEEAMKPENAAVNLSAAAEQAFRLLSVWRRMVGA